MKESKRREREISKSLRRGATLVQKSRVSNARNRALGKLADQESPEQLIFLIDFVY